MFVTSSDEEFSRLFTDNRPVSQFYDSTGSISGEDVASSDCDEDIKIVSKIKRKNNIKKNRKGKGKKHQAKFTKKSHKRRNKEGNMDIGGKTLAHSGSDDDDEEHMMLLDDDDDDEWV